jgi:hypothetical protein
LLVTISTLDFEVLFRGAILIVFYVFAGMAFMFPVAAYLLFLAIINGRPHATVVSGPWDFAGVLFATSGFWLLGGPLTLTTFHARWRPAFMRGETTELAGGEWAFLWVLPWVFYFALVFGGSFLLLWRRRRWTVIYNMPPHMLDEILANVLGQLGLTGSRSGNRVMIRSADGAASEPTSEAIQPASGRTSGRAMLSTEPLAPASFKEQDEPGLATVVLDPFPAMHHVSLYWQQGNQTVRRDVEAELARKLLDTESPDNHAAGWLLTVSSCLFSAIFLGLVFFVFLVMRR